MFRRERPQKGRYRQFNQINFENFGSDDFFADIEIINLANTILKKILPDNKITLHINSLGKRENLLKYKKVLSNFFNQNKQLLSKESLEKINYNSLRILDSKNKEDKEVINKSPKIIEFLSKEDLENYEEIKKCLIDLDIPIYENLTLVRGLDYYCNTVFEFKTEEIGSQDTLIGGGRYNGLIKTLGGKDIPGVGWAGGIERIMLLMKDISIKDKTIHLAILDPSYKIHAIKIYDHLIKNNYSVYWNYKYNLKKSLSIANQKKANFIVIVGENENLNDNFSVYWNYKYNLKKSLSLASEKKAKYIIIVGEKEKTNKNFALKNLISGEQKIVDLNNILDHIK